MDANSGSLIFSEGAVAENIQQLDLLLQRYEFHVTHRLLHPLLEMIKAWEREAGVDPAKPAELDLLKMEDGDKSISGATATSPRALTQEETEKLWRRAEILREALLAEASGKINYAASDKRYTIQKLTDEFSTLMASGVFAELPEIAQVDMREAGRCIAYELPTSAAFHLMRGTEAVLRHYYCCKVRRNRIKQPLMWGPMVTHLKEKKVPAGLLDALDSIRRNYRNPTQHPDKVYDLDEAQDLLSLSLDVTNRMIRDIQVANAKTP
ncbi:hypothetical protein [Arthrobacter sp. NicSoilC5]|uniref:hypothetical protein n=1 Tax=Arthrobacter sp. NicSoilC5 TaxID=2831000 RepID=UPI001CC511A5|nr:hypothetical protein [Arthrobacter sp. NicSoilC5]